MAKLQFPELVEERNSFIIDRVKSGDFDARWVEIETVVDNSKVKLLVMEDALKINGVRVNVSARLSQKLADLFDASLPTAMIADMMYFHATRKAKPRPHPISSSTSTMKNHSAAVDSELVTLEGLAATVGKHWILDKQLETKKDKACNYGWHFSGPKFQGISGATPARQDITGPDIRVIQPNATAHDMDHVDYSQICQLVSQRCWIDDIEMKLSDVIKDDNLSKLVSHQGKLSITRQPGTKYENDSIVNFPIYVKITP